MKSARSLIRARPRLPTVAIAGAWFVEITIASKRFNIYRSCTERGSAEVTQAAV
jgi:hypothetical protein